MNDQVNNYQRKYDLEERTTRYAEKVIDLMKKLSNNSVNKRMIEQEVGCAGSIGANYCEATEAESKKDFIHKIGIAKKEIKESRHWLKLLYYANPKFKEEFMPLLSETQELLLIFSSIIRSSKINKTPSAYVLIEN